MTIHRPGAFEVYAVLLTLVAVAWFVWLLLIIGGAA